MLPSFYREIAGVSGLKPDWACGFRRRMRSRTAGSHPPRAPGLRWARVPLLLLRHTSSSRRGRRGSLQTPAVSSAAAAIRPPPERLLPRIGKPAASCRAAAAVACWRACTSLLWDRVGTLARSSTGETADADSCAIETLGRPAGSNWAEPSPAGGVLLPPCLELSPDAECGQV